MKQGKVYLVGAGPGDSSLITLKGLQCLKQADVVIYDHVLDKNTLNFAPRRAEKISAGKSSTHHNMEQIDINRLLVEKAQSGKVVVRLKGGDPFVFGRGGEEAEVLAQNHIRFEVVPGVSSAIAVPAYAGIPLTQRGLASSFTVVTGHEAGYKAKNLVDWAKISQGADTLIVLMAINNLHIIVENLVKYGRPLFTPAAVITNGAGNLQKSVIGTLADIVAKAKQSRIEPPGVLVVGEVVRLQEKLRWFDTAPLFGKRVLVTRAKPQAYELSRILASLGAIPIEMPTIKIIPTYSELDNSTRRLHNYHWLILTSSNGVEAFFSRLRTAGFDARHLNHLKIAAIGKATAAALKKENILADYVPRKFTSKGLLSLLKSQDMAGCQVLLPRADIASQELSQGLIKMGAQVEEVIAYHIVPDKKGVLEALNALLKGDVDIVTFTSSSTVTNLLSHLDKKKTVLNKTLIACIGPVTAATAKKAGLRVDVVAKKHTIDGLVEAIEQYLQEVK